MRFAAALVLTLALIGSAAALAPLLDATAGWRQGRATFYGGSQQYLSNFPDRYIHCVCHGLSYFGSAVDQSCV